MAEYYTRRSRPFAGEWVFITTDSLLASLGSPSLHVGVYLYEVEVSRDGLRGDTEHEFSVDEPSMILRQHKMCLR